MYHRFLTWLTDNSLRFYLFASVVTLLGMVIAYQSIGPAPKDHLVISAGNEDGAYYQYARRYAKILAHDGVELEVLSSNGTVENLQRLKDPDTHVNLAFIQGGVTKPDDAESLASLASLYYEPIWLFYHEKVIDKIDQIIQLDGHRLAIGAVGSGTYEVVRRLMVENGLKMTAQKALQLGGGKAAEALLRGEIDGAFFIASPTSPALQSLFKHPDIQLMNFKRAGAYSMRYPFLTKVEIPQGTFDLKRDIPQQDINMVATTANLVARRDLHPALVDLMLATATRVHGKGGMFERRGQFPSPDYVDLPLSEEAYRYLSHGPDFLDRYLPFWAATMINRFKVMLVPILLLFVPLFKILPPLFIWRIRSRINRWYKELIKLEHEALDGSEEKRQSTISRLDEIDAALLATRVPGAFNKDLYILREHVDMLRSRLDHRGS